MPTREPSPDRRDVPARDAEPKGSEPYRDLCSNCDHAPPCGGSNRPRRPVFFCEGFEVLGAPSTPDLDLAFAQQPRQMRSVSGRSGLCVNCDLVETCTLPRPEGGVWHCEEYR